MNTITSQLSRKASRGRGERCSTCPAKAPYPVIKLGVDTHGQQYTFARLIDHQGAQPPQRLGVEAFLEFLKKQTTLAQEVVMVYEAGPYGYTLYRQATAMGVRCLVCAPERLSRGRKRANDTIDARELLSRLDRYLSGNTTALRLVRVPSLAEEMRRRQSREREVYRKERQRWMARGRSLLHSLGIARPGKWWQPYVLAQWHKQVSQQYGQEPTQQAWKELEGYRQAMQEMEKRRQELTQCLRRSAAQRGHRRLKGIGRLGEELLEREIGSWERFANRRQVASYTGLCPGEASSGESQRHLSIDKHGNPRVRAVLVELAWLLPRYQPRYCRLKRWRQVLAQGGAGRKKAVVALARQLAVDLWRIKTGRVQPQELGLKWAA